MDDAEMDEDMEEGERTGLKYMDQLVRLPIPFSPKTRLTFQAFASPSHPVYSNASPTDSRSG